MLSGVKLGLQGLLCGESEAWLAAGWTVRATCPPTPAHPLIFGLFVAPGNKRFLGSETALCPREVTETAAAEGANREGAHKAAEEKTFFPTRAGPGRKPGTFQHYRSFT